MTLSEEAPVIRTRLQLLQRASGWWGEPEEENLHEDRVQLEVDVCAYDFERKSKSTVHFLQTHPCLSFPGHSQQSRRVDKDTQTIDVLELGAQLIKANTNIQNTPFGQNYVDTDLVHSNQISFISY